MTEARNDPRRWLPRCILAVVVTCAAFACRQILVKHFGLNLPPFILFYPAVMFVALLEGFWPGLVATGTAALLADYYIMPPTGSFGITSPSDAISLAFFTGMGILMSLVAERYIFSLQRSVELEKELALKESTAKLEQTEREFEALANAIPQLAWTAHPDGWITWYNQRWYDYTGTTPQQMQGWGWRSVHHPETLTAVLVRWKASIATGVPFDMVLPLRGADGIFRPFLTRVMPVKDADGKVLRWFGTNTDISEQKRAEEEAKKTRDLLETFVQNAPAGLAMFDRNMRYLRASRKWQLDTGLGTDELEGKCHYDVFPNLPEHWAEMHQRGMAGESLRDEEEWIAADGSKRTIAWAIHPWGDSGAESGGIIIFSEDITERKKVQEELRTSKERLATIIGSTMDAIITLDANQRIVVFNPAAEKIFGCQLNEVLGQSIDRFIPPEFRESHRGRIENFSRTGATARSMYSPATLYGLRADGERFPLEATISRGNIGGESLYTVILRDITQRKQAEEALRASEERWATTLHSIGDAVISTDAMGRVDYMNEVAEKLLGCELTEAKGKDLDEVFDIVQEETRIKPESPVAKVIRLGQVIGLANHTVLIRRDGTEIPIEDSAAPIRDKQGNIEGVVLVFHDASEQRRFEKALRNNERLATTGRLAATIAHEIHNPLDAVGNLLYLAAHGTKEDSTREFVSEATRELGRVTQMTQQMLSFQREASKPIPVNIGEILDSVVSLYERKIMTAGIQLRKQVDADGHLLALPGELRQVFANLVGNAIEAVGKKNGTIALRAYQSRNWQTGQAGVRVLVADNGPGIPAHVRDKIFEPFFTTKGESGTGLGLWITSDILHKYHGTIRLRSDTREGRSCTHFSLFFPYEAGTESL